MTTRARANVASVLVLGVVAAAVWMVTPVVVVPAPPSSSQLVTEMHVRPVGLHDER